MSKIRVGYASRAIGTAPVWTACEAGYFRAQGLEVEPVLYEGSIAVTRGLEAGDIQLANYAAPAAIQANLERGADLVIVLGAMNRMMQSLMGRPGVTGVEALKGGTIGVNEWGEVNHWLVEALLPRLGLVAGRDVRIVETGRAHGKAWNTKVPADALILHPPEPFAAVKAGWTVLVDLRDLNVPFQLSCIAGRRDWIAGHRPAVERYLRGHVEGILRFNADRDFGLKVARKWGSPVDDDVLARTWEFASREFSTRPFPTAAAVAGILAAMRGKVAGADPARAADYVDDGFMTALEAGGVLQDLQRRHPPATTDIPRNPETDP